MRSLLVAVVAIGCGGASTRPAARAAAPPDTRHAIVQIELGDSGDGTTGRALLDGTDLKLAIEHEPGKSEGRAVVYPHGTHAVLLGWSIYGHYGRPNGSDALYEVDCATRTAKPYFSDPRGDFGHATMTRDGRTIFYSALGGVRALDVATRQSRQVTPQVELKTCGDRTDPVDDQGNPQPRIALSAVRALAEDEAVLIYEDGDNCGFEGDWDATTMYLDHPTTPGGKPYAPRPVTGVAVDAGGAVWASTGVCNALGLWRSTDRGEHWQRVAPPATEGDGGPHAILADAKRPGAVVIETTSCGPMGAEVANRFLATHDGGGTWKSIALPPSDAEPFDLIKAFATRDGSIDHLIAWGSVRHADAAVDTAWAWSAQPSPDDEGWTELDPVPPVAATSSTEAHLGELTFRASPNGLLRSRGGDRPTKLFPQ